MGSKLTHHACSIAIVGVGQVGGAVAFGLILSSLASEILLVDTDATKRNGQVRDLADAAYAHGGGTRVRAATHHEAGQCDIVVITAGSKQIIGTAANHVSYPWFLQFTTSRAYNCMVAQAKRRSRTCTTACRLYATSSMLCLH